MPDNTTRVFRVSLQAKLYRDIEIGGEKSLYDLAESIIQAFDFDFDHAFGFYGKLTGHYTESPVKYELFTDMGDADSDAGSVKRTKAAQAFPTIGKTMRFLFDYGDGWPFKVELIALGAKAAKSRYPKIVASVGKAPPQYPDVDEE